MNITFNPARRDEQLVLSRAGDVLTVNGEAFDFSPLADGATLPAEAIASDWFSGPVERIDGVLHVVLTLPHGVNAPEETRFPAPVTLTTDGPVAVPAYEETDNAD